MFEKKQTKCFFVCFVFLVCEKLNSFICIVQACTMLMEEVHGTQRWRITLPLNFVRWHLHIIDKQKRFVLHIISYQPVDFPKYGHIF